MTKFLNAKWDNLIMANYAIDPALLKPYLPPGVELDLFEGKAYASLVGFMFRNTRIFKVPIPYFGTFEEINLRFYVKRIMGNEIRRGVVFVNETIPYKPVAWLANKLYNENYIAIPTKHSIKDSSETKHVKYEWKLRNKWHSIEVQGSSKSDLMESGSVEEFIFEHYYGYTKTREGLTQEYKVEHPRWLTHKVLNYEVKCDFAEMYGESFGFLSATKPDSVLLSEGSEVAIEWKRQNF